MKEAVILSEAKELFHANCFAEEFLRFAQDDEACHPIRARSAATRVRPTGNTEPSSSTIE
jgi:hypothetical protein